jgi:Uma2 family endonuclease
MAGTEWHFQVQPPGEIGRTLVPDVAYLSYARMPKTEMEDTEIPRLAPDVVVEVRSPEDHQRDIDEKIRVYLSSGAQVVFLVDPAKRAVVAFMPGGATIAFGDDDTIRLAALPGFELPARDLFELP